MSLGLIMRLTCEGGSMGCAVAEQSCNWRSPRGASRLVHTSANFLVFLALPIVSSFASLPLSNLTQPAGVRGGCGGGERSTEWGALRLLC